MPGVPRKSPGILRGSGGLVVVICKMSMRYIKCVHILRQCCLPHLTNHSMKPPYQNFLLLHTQTDHVLEIGGNCACTPSASTVVFPSACGTTLSGFSAVLIASQSSCISTASANAIPIQNMLSLPTVQSTSAHTDEFPVDRAGQAVIVPLAVEHALHPVIDAQHLRVLLRHPNRTRAGGHGQHHMDAAAPQPVDDPVQPLELVPPSSGSISVKEKMPTDTALTWASCIS